MLVAPALRLRAAVEAAEKAVEAGRKAKGAADKELLAETAEIAALQVRQSHCHYQCHTCLRQRFSLLGYMVEIDVGWTCIVVTARCARLTCVVVTATCVPLGCCCCCCGALTLLQAQQRNTLDDLELKQQDAKRLTADLNDSYRELTEQQQSASAMAAALRKELFEQVQYHPVTVSSNALGDVCSLT